MAKARQVEVGRQVGQLILLSNDGVDKTVAEEFEFTTRSLTVRAAVAKARPEVREVITANKSEDGQVEFFTVDRANKLATMITIRANTLRAGK